MSNILKKMNSWSLVIMISFVLMTSLCCPTFGENIISVDAYADNPFAPPVLVPFDAEQIQLARTNSSIKLDSKKINHPEFDLDFISPSEYKVKTYRNSNNEFIPVDEPQEQKENILKSDDKMNSVEKIVNRKSQITNSLLYRIMKI